MTTGFGFCANCGTPAGAPDEKFCASCGAAMPANAASQAAAAAAPMAAVLPAAALPPTTPPPPWATMPPPPYAAAPPPPYAAAPTPPPYAQPYAPVPPAPGQPAWGTPPIGTYGARPRTAVNPLFLVAGVLVIVAIVAAGAFALANGNKSSGSPGTGHPGTLVFSPSTVSCDGMLTITTTLPSTVKDSDPITLKVDGTAGGTHTVVEAGLTKQADGSWSGTSSGAADCTMGAGLHTEQLVDANGKVLAEGTFTIAGSTASASVQATPEATATANPKPTMTPKPTKTPKATVALAAGYLTMDPSSFSCSAAPVDVVLTISLPSSLTADSEVTSVIDGSTGETGTVGANFDQQPDGSWLSTSTNSSTTICTEYDPGTHTIGFEDSNGNPIVEGSFTVEP